MSDRNHNLKTKTAASVALVALSGVVPQPFVQQAYADTATISVTGKFISGITLIAGTNVQMGSLIATGSTGKLSVTAGGGTVTASGTFLGAPTAGTVKITAKATQPVDITVKGFGALTVTTGTATLSKVYISGPITVNVTLSGGTATSADSQLNVGLNASAVTAAPQTFNIGAGVTWTGNQPIGTFSQAINLIVGY